MYRGLKIQIGPTNSNPLDLLDLARRQFDHLGPDGIKAKSRQTNRRYSRKGNLRFCLRNRAQILKVVNRINRLGEPAIRVTRFRNPNVYPL